MHFPRHGCNRKKGASLWQNHHASVLLGEFPTKGSVSMCLPLYCPIFYNYLAEPKSTELRWVWLFWRSVGCLHWDTRLPGQVDLQSLQQASRLPALPSFLQRPTGQCLLLGLLPDIFDEVYTPVSKVVCRHHPTSWLLRGWWYGPTS